MGDLGGQAPGGILVFLIVSANESREIRYRADIRRSRVTLPGVVSAHPPVVAGVSPAKPSIAAGTAASTVGRMIKDRPHRLDRICVNQPLYFVTFATRDRRAIPSLDDAQLALQRYGHCGID